MFSFIHSASVMNFLNSNISNKCWWLNGSTWCYMGMASTNLAHLLQYSWRCFSSVGRVAQNGLPNRIFIFLLISGTGKQLTKCFNLTIPLLNIIPDGPEIVLNAYGGMFYFLFCSCTCKCLWHTCTSAVNKAFFLRKRLYSQILKICSERAAQCFKGSVQNSGWDIQLSARVIPPEYLSNEMSDLLLVKGKLFFFFLLGSLL